MLSSVFWPGSLGAFCLALLVAAPNAYGQTYDDKMMPPTLIAPQAPVDDDYDPALAADQFLSDGLDENDDPLSIYEVPMIDIPSDETDEAGDKPMRIGTFSMLHKVTAKVREVQLPAGEEVTIGEMTLVMHDCVSAPPEEPPETRSFLQISEFKHGADRVLFSGWMFASSPAIHALEHPVFDLWPLACKTADGLPYTGDELAPKTLSKATGAPTPAPQTLER